MVLDKEIGLYDATYFKMLKEAKNPLRDIIITDIIPDTFGEIFFLITSNGALYESKVGDKKMTVLQKQLNTFVSQGAWNTNLNSLLLADDFYLSYYNPISGEEKEDVNKFRKGLSDQDFAKLPYKKKDRYLDIYIKLIKCKINEKYVAH